MPFGKLNFGVIPEILSFFSHFCFPLFHDLFLSLGSLKNLGLMDIVLFGEKTRKGKIHVTDFVLSHGMFACEESLSKCVAHSRCSIDTAVFVSPSPLLVSSLPITSSFVLC